MKKILTLIAIFLLPLATFAQVNTNAGPAYSDPDHCGTPCIPVSFIDKIGPNFWVVFYVLIYLIILKIIQKITHKKITSMGMIIPVVTIVYLFIILFVIPVSKDYFSSKNNGVVQPCIPSENNC